MIRVTLIDRTPHQRMNGVARYMLGITSYPDPQAMGVDLRILNWGRELSPPRWRKQFSPAAQPHAVASYCNRKWLRPLAQRWSRADIIHYPFHYLPHDWMTGRGAKIVTVHGASAYSPDLWEPQRGERIKRGLQLGWDVLAQVITVSKWSKMGLIEHFKLPAHKITVIPNGVRLDLFRPIPQKAQVAAWLATTFGIHTPYLLHVGPCVPRKNPVRLIQAFANLKQQRAIPHTLVFAGATGSLSKTVQQEVSKLGIADSVIFTGVVNDAALVKLYNGADIFLFPSLYEGFGIPVLEAMACGTPVITSNTTALQEVAGSAAALVDDPTSLENLTHVFEQVITNNTLQSDLRQRGLVHVQQYSWQKCAIAHLELYKQVAKD